MILPQERTFLQRYGGCVLLGQYPGFTHCYRIHIICLERPYTSKNSRIFQGFSSLIARLRGVDNIEAEFDGKRRGAPPYNVWQFSGSTPARLRQAPARHSLGESAEGTLRRVQVASTNAPTCVKLRIEFVQRNDGMIPHDWQIDMAEACLGNPDVPVIRATQVQQELHPPCLKPEVHKKMYLKSSSQNLGPEWEGKGGQSGCDTMGGNHGQVPQTFR
ncbi:hypothetical protein B0H14DRAFT_2639260 [Mycena olivaceomarginata]|nr:hypothetical protein B0H14DRAFT_2639260 [Mycena olivaceomarginata]